MLSNSNNSAKTLQVNSPQVTPTQVTSTPVNSTQVTSTPVTSTPVNESQINQNSSNTKGTTITSKFRSKPRPNPKFTPIQPVTSTTDYQKIKNA